jgi:phage portal protein BeeE
VSGKGFTLGDELDTDEYAARFAKNYFYNNTIPAAVIAIEGMPNGDTPAAKRFKEDLKKNHGGPDNAGNVLVTGGKTTISRLDTDFQKMDLAALRKGARDFIRMNFRVPPEIVGDLTSSNKATAWAAHDALAKNCIVPRAEFLRSEFQLRLMPRVGQEGDFLDYESPVPADQEQQLRVMGTFPTAFTGNEARALAGMKPRPGLDETLAPMPGQVEAGPKTPDAPQGSQADTTEEQSQPSNKKSDPPWADQPIV